MNLDFHRTEDVDLQYLAVKKGQSSDDSSDESLMAPPVPTIWRSRGPSICGITYFDKHCMFGNDMELSPEQQEFLLQYCQNAGHPNTHMQFYVHQMNHSNVMPNKCKMTFEARFTKNYLKKYLAQPVQVDVSCTTSRTTFQIRLKLGLFSSNAIMTSKWYSVVHVYMIQKGDIVLFKFEEASGGGLHLELAKLPYYYEEDDAPPATDDSDSDDSDENELSQEINKIWTRGPEYFGDESFDDHCIYGNLVKLNFNQVMHLRKQAENYPRHPIKMYVCRMLQKYVSTANRKMVFNSDYTASHLAGFMEAPMEVAMNCTTSFCQFYVTMKAGTRGDAVITTGCDKAVESFKLKEGDICLFTFHDERKRAVQDPRVWLRIVIAILQPNK